MLLVLLLITSFGLFMTFMAWAPAAALIFICKRLSFPPPETAYAYWRVLKWPAILGIISFWGVDYLTNRQAVSDLFFFAMFLAYWFLLRNVGHDDHEQKKPRRVRARLKQVGGRLVVVPERLA